MRVTIKIDCDNAAFEDNESGEVARILQLAAAWVKDNAAFNPGYTMSLFDVNGNRVGILKVKG